MSFSSDVQSVACVELGTPEQRDQRGEGGGGEEREGGRARGREGEREGT